jgi:hypothetical protein
MTRIIFPFLLIAFLIFDPRLGMASSGRFDCKVKKIDITEFIEGQVKTYGGWDNFLRVNDELELKYRSKLSGGFTGIEIIASELISVFGVGVTEVDQLIEFESGDIIIEEQDNKIWFGEDYISAHSSFMRKKALSMRRYYKNDWEAIIIEQSHDDRSIESSTVALTCRHKKDGIKQITAELKEFVAGIK